MRLKKIIITIDGFSSCGKSTLAKDLSERLKYRYIDTGAMYRAVTYYFLQNQVVIEDAHQVKKALDEIQIDFDYDKETGKQITILNHISVDKEIRQTDVNKTVSRVSALKEVREKMVAQQQKLGQRKGIVMDGRDIGTVVFPQAELKIFLTADELIRVERRYQELIGQNVDMSKEEVAQNLKERDYLDSTRKESPLRKADDAIVLDNTHLSREEQVEWVMEHFLQILVT